MKNTKAKMAMRYVLPTVLSQCAFFLFTIIDGIFVGHGVGTQMHESPEIPNYGHPGRGPRLLRGMTLAIEPMVNAGSAAIQQLSDGWTVKTLDGKWAAHYENTILITDGEPEILTAPAI